MELAGAGYDEDRDHAQNDQGEEPGVGKGDGYGEHKCKKGLDKGANTGTSSLGEGGRGGRERGRREKREGKKSVKSKYALK